MPSESADIHDDRDARYASVERAMDELRAAQPQLSAERRRDLLARHLHGGWRVDTEALLGDAQADARPQHDAVARGE